MTTPAAAGLIELARIVDGVANALAASLAKEQRPVARVDAKNRRIRLPAGRRRVADPEIETLQLGRAEAALARDLVADQAVPQNERPRPVAIRTGDPIERAVALEMES